MEIIRTQSLAIAGKPAAQQQRSPANEVGASQGHDGQQRPRGRDGGVLAAGADDRAPLRYERTEKLALHLKTQEGDDVRLKFSSRESGGSEAAVGADNSDDGEGVTLEPSNRTKIALKVEGNLNSDEFSAIRDAFDQVAQLAEQFFSGGIQSAFESAASLSIDADQLISFEFRARIEDRVTYAAASFTSSPAVEAEPEAAAVVPADDVPQVTAGNDRPAIAVEAPSETSVQPREVDAESGEMGLTVTDDPVEVIDPAAAGGEETGAVEGEASEEVQALDPQKLIGRFLGHLREGLMGGFGQQSGVMDFSIKVRMFQETISTIAEARSDDGGGLPKLVPDTLEAIASKEEQGPLDRRA